MTEAGEGPPLDPAGAGSQTSRTGAVLALDEVRALGIVVGAQEEGWRSCGYDLAARTVVDHRGRSTELEDGKPFEIPAHGMIEVIAHERLEMPSHVVGYAMVKTGLTVSGIFALNIGILDPNYRGGVSTTLINFGKSPFELKLNERFLRLTFHWLSKAVEDDKRVPPLDASKYLEERKRKAKEHFSETFLDMAATAEEASRKLLGLWQSRLLFWLPVGALFLTALALCLSAGQWIGRLLEGQRQSSPTHLSEEQIGAICLGWNAKSHAADVPVSSATAGSSREPSQAPAVSSAPQPPSSVGSEGARPPK